MNKQRFWIVLLVLSVVITIFIYRQQNNSTHIQRPTLADVGYQAPPLELTDLEGNHMNLQSLRGKIVFINFWASWCPPCIHETPDLVKLSDVYKGKVEFIGVNATHQDQLSEVRSFIKTYHISYPILLDLKGEATKQYRANYKPTSFLIDADGTIVYKKIGSITPAELEKQLKQLLKK